jgi:SAM-dependent methyltransferase
MHDAARAYVRGILETVPLRVGPVLEIGGRDINGSIRPLFGGIGPYASIDLRDGRGVDLVADVCTLDPRNTALRLFGRKSVACVVCCEVLEHATEPGEICRWAHRVLMPGGLFIVTAANPDRFEHSGIDGGPLRRGEHYAGVTTKALTSWLRLFATARTTTAGADIYAVAWKGRR